MGHLTVLPRLDWGSGQGECDPLHEIGEVAVGSGPEQQVPVIGHDAVAAGQLTAATSFAPH